MSKREEQAALSLRRAVANLLRLAAWNLKDAELLSAGRNPENAPFPVSWAVHRIVEAVVATERGWPISPETVDLAQVPDENPFKLALAPIAKLTPPPKLFTLLPDGNIPQTFDREGFRRDVAAVRMLLQDFAERFGVDLLGDGPAKQAAPDRPQAAPQPEPPKTQQKLSPLSAPSASPGKTHSRPSAPKPKPPKGDSRRPPIAIPDTRTPRRAKAEPHDVEGRSPIGVTPIRTSPTSSAFWTLMDRWNVPDLAALALIGHPGGLSKKGTRPRFKLLGEEAEMVKLLLEIDQALTALGPDATDWLSRPIKSAPFAGATLITYLTHNGLNGVRETSRYILKNGLKISMSGLS